MCEPLHYRKLTDGATNATVRMCNKLHAQQQKSAGTSEYLGIEMAHA